MAKIAVKFAPQAAPVPSRQSSLPSVRLLARGKGWSVSDVICTAGPGDHSFEERHSRASIGMVLEGTFQYRSAAGRELMTPGSLLLGNPGQCYECGHEHARGDHCIAFDFDPEYFETLAEESGVHLGRKHFSALRVPPVKELSPLVARAAASLAGSADIRNWEEISLELALRALESGNGRDSKRGNSLAAEARVTRIVRLMETSPGLDHELGALAREARLSRYHFLRVFQQLTGLTPHRYLRRLRLRRAATRLAVEPAQVLEIALDSGFGDISNFNHAFQAEFGLNPRTFRRNAMHQPSPFGGSELAYR
ncbi:MAG TPA: AraC family transcriptional regulator [Candidatus Angelobacter sp.]|nr:AraC family transcriptional regulator [Candidatus Angelobacter sp.]